MQVKLETQTDHQSTNVLIGVRHVSRMPMVCVSWAASGPEMPKLESAEGEGCVRGLLHAPLSMPDILPRRTAIPVLKGPVVCEE
mmetsp:Transcript_32298/g.75870  ORF Transcript_32298/g.75870 Transcript_32298/m.75870 type:complete len:84 (+) Transcript_32298:104-355(+)